VRLVPQLVTCGHQVTAWSRSLDKVERPRATGQHTPEGLTLLLAKEFEVSEAAMVYRLINLGITT
jgi:hypothetical protein